MPATELLGGSPAIASVREQLRRLAEGRSRTRRPVPVLIEGETGTGKGLVARTLHRAGPRAREPFVDVNGAAVPETLLEAELFGFERGAFTDARQAKPGLFQVAHRGVIFLDEIGLLPEALQGKLLKVIEEREVRRLGSTRVEPVDVAVVAATSEDLQMAVRDGRFRGDLYHRLAVVTIRLPPLRQRGDDVVLLAEHFLEQACREYGVARRSLTPDARAALRAHGWPGNVRELINVMERVALLSDDVQISARTLDLAAPPAGRSHAGGGGSGVPLKDALRELARTRVVEALEGAGWNVTRAAERLGVPRGTLRYWVRRYALQPASAPAGLSPAKTAPATPSVERAAIATERRAPGVRWERRRLTLLRAVFQAADAPVPDSGRLLDVSMDKVRAFGGRIEEIGPSGIVGVFGLDPTEDPPRRAAHAAAAIVRAVERAGERVDPRVAIKVGLHTDHLLVGWSTTGPEIDLGGKRAAWEIVEGLVASPVARPVAVSAATFPFLARRFTLIPEGSVYRLVGPERAAPGRSTAFVGRQHELALMRSRLDSVAAGRGHIVAIVGEPGMGKSRLLFEFRRGLGDRRATSLEGCCLAHPEAVPYLPVLQMLEQACRITERDSPPRILRKIRCTLRALGIAPDEAAPALLMLLGINAGTEELRRLPDEVIGARIREILRQTCVAAARRGPLLLVVEDLQWIDHASEQNLSLLSERLPALPILLVVTYRPGFQPAWIARSYATQIALAPLSVEDSIATIRSILPEAGAPPGVADRSARRAGGNPFFLEELALAVREHGAADGEPAVPATVQDVLLARVEHTPPDMRRLLQAASVAGREVSVPLLRLLADDPDRFDALLAELTRREFPCPQGAAEDETYAFRHALTQEVVYQALPAPERIALHGAAGRALETLHADQAELPGRAAQALARHFAQAEVWDKRPSSISCTPPGRPLARSRPARRSPSTTRPRPPPSGCRGRRWSRAGWRSTGHGPSSAFS